MLGKAVRLSSQVNIIPFPFLSHLHHTALYNEDIRTFLFRFSYMPYLCYIGINLRSCRKKRFSTLASYGRLKLQDRI